MTLKQDFLKAITEGELGTWDDIGVTVSLREFRQYFKDIESGYLTSFLPASVIEEGQCSASHTRFLFRIKKGLYRVHPDALDEYCLLSGHKALASWKQQAPRKTVDFLSLKF